MKKQYFIIVSIVFIFISVILGILLAGIRFEPPPMGESPYVPCDLDHDGDCDEVDEQIFNDAFGKCRGELGYSFNADIDGDGCVDTADKQAFELLFPESTK